MVVFKKTLCAIPFISGEQLVATVSCIEYVHPMLPSHSGTEVCGDSRCIAIGFVEFLSQDRDCVVGVLG